ncbi:MAG: endospore germination permease [Clostridium sp.]|uniref:GerAB/ArcD/ProY family transporter n=1 Tax=Clostridium sp. TaxID=1506 RepID=UPI0029094EEC|nr:endospore germination permease [Clostridium sp.]MDU7337696.1 endospore germination permease [Clostridium sp.]
MKQERIANRQLFSMVTLFVIGSSLIIGVATQVTVDKWIAILVALPAAIPTLWLYMKLLSIYPGKNLFDIFVLVFGKWIGQFFVLLYTWYAFHLGSMVLRNFGEFVKMMAMPETPMMVPLIFMAISCIWIVREGIEVLGRSAFFLLPIMVLIILIVQFLCIPQLNPEFITPILADGWKPVLEGAFSTYTFPFAETVLIATIFCCPVNKKVPYKPFLGGFLAGVVIILAVTFRNILVLGAVQEMGLYFPSYIAVGRIRIGDFLQRIEVTVSIVFVVGAFIKISVCLLATCMGIKKLAGLNSFRSVAIPVGILMILFSYTLYSNAMEMVTWAFETYSFYALPFQIFIPLILLAAAMFQRRNENKSSALPSS